MPFEKHIKDIRKFQAGLNTVIIEALKDQEAEIVDLNTSQLAKGETSEGTQIKPDYAEDDYADFKKSIGSKAPKGTPDLLVEGDFYEGFNVNIFGDTVQIDSSDEKTPNLERKYNNIFGLNKENTAIIAANIQPIILKSFQDAITR